MGIDDITAICLAIGAWRAGCVAIGDRLAIGVEGALDRGAGTGFAPAARACVIGRSGHARRNFGLTRRGKASGFVRWMADAVSILPDDQAVLVSELAAIRFPDRSKQDAHLVSRARAKVQRARRVVPVVTAEAQPFSGFHHKWLVKLEEGVVLPVSARPDLFTVALTAGEPHRKVGVPNDACDA